jgi:ubiquinone/menaquinone biosynthesis C-methylase UbiE
MDAKTVETYNQLAQAYDDETVDFWNTFPRSFIEAFVNASGPNILNIGSGPGRDARLLQNAGKNVICLDASQTMIDICQARGLTTVLADFNHLPFDATTFDGVWAYTSLVHIPKNEIDQPLREIHRVLKPNDILAIGMIEGDSEGYKQNTGGIDLPRWFSYYQKEELMDIITNHGFDLIHFETFTPGSKTYLNLIFKKLS